jgi:hypothetical protein
LIGHCLRTLQFRPRLSRYCTSPHAASYSSCRLARLAKCFASLVATAPKMPRSAPKSRSNPDDDLMATSLLLQHSSIVRFPWILRRTMPLSVCFRWHTGNSISHPIIHTRRPPSLSRRAREPTLRTAHSMQRLFLTPALWQQDLLATRLRPRCLPNPFIS